MHAHLHAPSVMEAVYRKRCHKKKESGRPKPEIRVQNSQSLSPFLPAMNLQNQSVSSHRHSILNTHQIPFDNHAGNMHMHSSELCREESQQCPMIACLGWHTGLINHTFCTDLMRTSW